MTSYDLLHSPDGISQIPTTTTADAVTAAAALANIQGFQSAMCGTGFGIATLSAPNAEPLISK